jgi:hypothetical protein
VADRGKKSWWRWQLGSERRSRWADWATIVGAPLALAAVVVAVITAVLGGSGGGAPPAPGPSSPDLQGISLVVRNDVDSDRKPGLEVLLDNAGMGRSVISGATVEVLRMDPLPLCFTQGELPLGGHYGAQLSTEAEPGEVVEVPLHQQLAADEADRFLIALGLTGDEEGDGGELPGLYLFELDVSLTHDGAPRPLHLGRALVSLPAPPYRSTYFWGDDTARFLRTYLHSDGLSEREFWAVPMRCWTANTEALRRGLSGSAARSPQLAAIGAELVTPTFAALEK